MMKDGCGKPLIGLFNDSFPPVLDGVTLTVQNYAEWLTARDINVCVVTPDSPQKPQTPFEVMRYFSLPIASRPPYRYGYPKLDLTVRRRLREKPFALVHSHSPFSAGRLARYTAEKHDIPLIGTFHSKYRTDLQHSFRFTPWMVPIIMRRILNFFNACDQVWIPQLEVEATLREYGYRGDVEVVPNGNDLASIPEEKIPACKKSAREKLGIPQESLSLLFVGQHIWPKGIGLILDALIALKERKVPFQMHYIGSGYAASELAQRIKDAGLQDCIFMHGQLSEREQLARHYAAADLFLFPSLYDNAPLVVREAAALGTPALIPAGSTAAGVIMDGANGFLPAHSATDYARVLDWLSHHRALIPQVGMQARRTLTQSWQEVMTDVTSRYIDLIKTLKK